MKNILTPPQLITPRLVLRPLQERDLPQMHCLRSNSAIAASMCIPVPEDERVTAAYIQEMLNGMKRGKWLFWTIAKADEDLFIGSITLWNYNPQQNDAELGYSLLPEQQRRGYMREALGEVERYAFATLQLDRLHAYTAIDNLRSRKLLENSGFSQNGEIEETNPRGGLVRLAKYSKEKF